MANFRMNWKRLMGADKNIEMKATNEDLMTIRQAPPKKVPKKKVPKKVPLKKKMPFGYPSVDDKLIQHLENGWGANITSGQKKLLLRLKLENKMKQLRRAKEVKNVKLPDVLTCTENPSKKRIINYLS